MSNPTPGSNTPAPGSSNPGPGNEPESHGEPTPSPVASASEASTETTTDNDAPASLPGAIPGGGAAKVNTGGKPGKKTADKGNKKEPQGLWHGTVKPILQMVVLVFVIRSMVIDWNDVPSGSMLPTIQIGDRIAVNRLSYGLNTPIPFLRHDREGNGFLDLPFTHKTVPMPIPGQLIRWSDPERGDIVIVWSPAENGPLGTRLVKRVVGLPGDRIAVRNGELYVNGTKCEYTPVDELHTQTADGRTHTVQTFEETLPGTDFKHAIQMPEPLPPGQSYQGWINKLNAKHMAEYRLTPQAANNPGLAQALAEKKTNEQLNATGVPRQLHDFKEITLEDGMYMCMGDNRSYSNDCRMFGPVSRKQITGRAFAVAASFENGKWTRPTWSRFFLGLQ